MMIKLGMIGCGMIANHHAPFLQELDGLDVTICCDLIEEKAATLAEVVGAESCTDYREVLDSVDAVWVCTEPFNRAEIVCDAAAAGKDIFTEKPVALNLADADRMIAAARDAGVIYMLGYCLRFWQPYKFMHETFVSGELGDLVNIWTRRYMPIDFRGTWYGDQNLSGGVALDFGSHDIDWMQWIAGKVTRVFARTTRIREGSKADEHSQSLLTFESGAMGACDVTWLDTITESSLGLLGTKGSLLVGRDGKVVKRMVGDEADTVIEIEAAITIDPEGNLGRRDESGEIQAVASKGESIHRHFLRCIQERLTPLTDASTGRDALRTVLAIRESAETGRAVDLPT